MPEIRTKDRSQSPRVGVHQRAYARRLGVRLPFPFFRARASAILRRAEAQAPARAALGACEECGAEAHFEGPDPYLEAIFDIQTPVRLCVTCHGQSVRDAA